MGESPDDAPSLSVDTVAQIPPYKTEKVATAFEAMLEDMIELGLLYCALKGTLIKQNVQLYSHSALGLYWCQSTEKMLI